jgi:hypothetical protein
MNLDTVSRKHRIELEQIVNNLLRTLRKAKVNDEALREKLRALQTELADTRRESFDQKHAATRW